MLSESRDMDRLEMNSTQGRKGNRPNSVHDSFESITLQRDRRPVIGWYCRMETLEEIAEENAGIFREAGGENFAYIPCLNDRKEHSTALAELLRSELPNWFSDEPPR